MINGATDLLKESPQKVIPLHIKYHWRVTSPNKSPWNIYACNKYKYKISVIFSKLLNYICIILSNFIAPSLIFFSLFMSHFVTIK